MTKRTSSRCNQARPLSTPFEPTGHTQWPPGWKAWGTAHLSPSTALPRAERSSPWPREHPGFCRQELGARLTTCCRPEQTRRPEGCRPQESKMTQDSLRGRNLNSPDAPRWTAGLASTCGDPLSGVQIQSLLKCCCVLSPKNRGQLGNTGPDTGPVLCLWQHGRGFLRPRGSRETWPSVSGQAAWKEARETQTIYGSPEGTWGPASSEVAARAHGVTYGNHIRRGPWHLETWPRQRRRFNRSRSLVNMSSKQLSQAQGSRNG